VVAGGDVDFSGGARSWLGADQHYDPLAGVKPVLEGSTLRVASLASALSAKSKAGKGGAMLGPESGAAALSRAGLDGVAVANGRLFAAGTPFFDETLAVLSRSHVTALGTTDDPNTLRPQEFQRDGWSVALFATGVWPDAGAPQDGKNRIALGDPARLGAAVRAARATHDVVLVSHHAGKETEDPPAEELALARAALEAGADAYFAHGARVPRGVGWVNDRPALYGLGSLVTDEDPKNPWTGRGLIARLAFSSDGQRTVDVCPYLIVDGEPKLLSGSGRSVQEGIFRRALERLSAGFGAVDIGEPDVHSCMRLGPPHAPPAAAPGP